MSSKQAGSEPPSDAVVRGAIVSALRSSSVDLRPNKLRKIVCRAVKGATWTQFATSLDGLVAQREIRTGENEAGEEVVIALRSDAAAPPSSRRRGSAAVDRSADGGPRDGMETAGGDSRPTAAAPASRELAVPAAVAMHLTRRGHTKQRNIERNTKTKLTVPALRGGKFVALDEAVTIKIECAPSRSSDRGIAVEDAAAAKHLKAAELFVQKIVDSYKKHPDHFAPKKAGGTLEEQRREKRRKDALALAAIQKQRRRKLKAGQHVLKNELGKKAESEESEAPSNPWKKRKHGERGDGLDVRKVAAKKCGGPTTLKGREDEEVRNDTSAKPKSESRKRKRKYY